MSVAIRSPGVYSTVAFLKTRSIWEEEGLIGCRMSDDGKVLTQKTKLGFRDVSVQ